MSKPFRVRELAQDRNITQEAGGVARANIRANISSTVRRIWQNNQTGSRRGRDLARHCRCARCDDHDLYTESDEQPATAPRANLGKIKSAHNSDPACSRLRGRPPRCTRHSAPCTGSAPARRTSLEQGRGHRPPRPRPRRIYGVAMRRYRCPFVDTTTWPKGTLMMPLPDLPQLRIEHAQAR